LENRDFVGGLTLDEFIATDASGRTMSVWFLAWIIEIFAAFFLSISTKSTSLSRASVQHRVMRSVMTRGRHDSIENCYQQLTALTVLNSAHERHAKYQIWPNVWAKSLLRQLSARSEGMDVMTSYRSKTAQCGSGASEVEASTTWCPPWFDEDSSTVCIPKRRSA